MVRMMLRPTTDQRQDLRGPLLTVVAALAGFAMLSYVVLMVLVVNADDTVALYIPDPVAPHHADLGERFPLPAPPAPPATPAGMVAPAPPAAPVLPAMPARPDQPVRPDRPLRPDR
jgi:hypothetical protein